MSSTIPTWTPPWEAIDANSVVSGTPADEVARVRYTEGQFLGAADLADEQRYHRGQLRRHGIGEHTWGIVTGLDLVETADPTNASFVDVTVTPGMAVDGYGRQIVVFAPVRLGAALFDAFTDVAHRSVWITYAETTAGDPGPGFAACGDGEPTRIIEGWNILIDPTVTTATVLVDGVAVAPAPVPTGQVLGPDDMSVPEQELPADVPVVAWMVRLGSVQWDGVSQRLVPAAPGRLSEQRRYLGAIAEHLLSPSADLRIAPRTKPVDVDAAEFATVEGRLRAQGRLTAERELWLEGQPARFTYDGGAEENVAITLGRQRGPSGLGHQLRLMLGNDPAAATTSFSIGADEGGPATTSMEVRANGTVEIPTGHLSFGATQRQEIDLDGAAHGIGTQSGVTYMRSDQEFAWYKGGSHVNTPLDPGPSGLLQLRLDSNGALDFRARTRQMIDLWSVAPGHNYGIGVQPYTLYFRTDFDVCWFRGGSHIDLRSSAGGGGTLAMRLDDASHLQVFGPISSSGAVDVAQDLTVSGALRVLGGAVDSVVKVRSFDVVCPNNGSSPGTWGLGWGTEFDVVLSAVAMLTGFSISNDIGSSTPGRYQDLKVIPQHVWVTVDSHSNTGANGRAFCAQSDSTQDSNNEVGFTLLVIGRKWS